MLKYGTERIYLKNILPMIDKKDIRSATKWCIKNDVEIFRDSTSGSAYAIAAEVNFALDKPIIQRYQKKYGDNWVKMYELAREDQLFKTISKSVNRNKNYKAKSTISNKFLTEL